MQSAESVGQGFDKAGRLLWEIGVGFLESDGVCEGLSWDVVTASGGRCCLRAGSDRGDICRAIGTMYGVLSAGLVSRQNGTVRIPQVSLMHS